MHCQDDNIAIKRIEFRSILVIIALCIAALALQGCGGGGGTTQSLATGILRGTAYQTDGVTPLANAVVYVPGSSKAASRAVAPAGALVWTTTGDDGTFVLTDVPVGTTTVKIEKDELTHTFAVNVNANETIDLPKASTTMAAGDGLDGPPGDPFGGGGDDPLDPPPSDPFNNGTVDSSNGSGVPVTSDGGLDMPPPPPWDSGLF